ncbi:MAG: tRNA preQ1(34) S-adenosylmethionine ribosyltransferase-isomerase QueA [candidate division KSB1 bacterium]|nr:tRNA preQ1(34) S-adenosylmethionine ribosyltransferase-isomerase QueA [candidate division KSB1 bacterium]MDZ7276167.1 tRNA preQ1(34) S-adenosylmethionine ribosyltransferase-isomerase QueA [candidate division KSB1 bacterium]MDZ7287053.1 tRNA preQ1(34) S-adenosylmethionine ribosyltransferase-isomerase QueA [candidate division KSB1 bacterium]MDZ7297022.1 tRNA preQ1(34) S-adenosylmethionine ribosyltransferase-isomerase QueA [candidate division KSB1 bacterium]MDZ7307528.1 tRNA preQ1(34) S-adenosy
MKLSDFKINIPEKLIAQYPEKKRDKSKLMVVDREQKTIAEKIFSDIVDYFGPDDCLVINETKVFPARLIGTKDKTEAKVEIFLLRQLENGLWEVLVRPARKVRVGNRLSVGRELSCDVIDNTVSGGRVVRFNFNGDFFEIVERLGQSPLPPYVKRNPEPMDKERYQTVYASVRGAVAAPTAGLHFTKELLKKISNKGTRIVPIVLHLGLGSFRPVIVEDLSRHKMDSEYFEISPATAQAINETMKKGGKVYAVGTSVVRALETEVTSEGWVKPGRGWTDKFIYPPYDFKIVDRLITNFHMPCSTMLMLVCAFANRDLIFKAYRKAIKEKWRFYSYGDAMLIL